MLISSIEWLMIMHKLQLNEWSKVLFLFTLDFIKLTVWNKKHVRLREDKTDEKDQKSEDMNLIKRVPCIWFLEIKQQYRFNLFDNLICLILSISLVQENFSHNMSWPHFLLSNYNRINPQFPFIKGNSLMAFFMLTTLPHCFVEIIPLCKVFYIKF